MLACYVPLELYCNNLVVWKNPVPNSASFARPVSLTKATEEQDIFSTELEQVFQSIIKNDLEETVFMAEGFENLVLVTFYIEHSLYIFYIAFFIGSYFCFGILFYITFGP